MRFCSRPADASRRIVVEWSTSLSPGSLHAAPCPMRRSGRVTGPAAEEVCVGSDPARDIRLTLHPTARLLQRSGRQARPSAQRRKPCGAQIRNAPGTAHRTRPFCAPAVPQTARLREAGGRCRTVRETGEVEPRISVDDGLHLGHFETCGSTNPQVFSSHISSHLFARQSETARNCQRLKPLVAGLSGTVRNGQNRL